MSKCETLLPIFGEDLGIFQPLFDEDRRWRNAPVVDAFIALLEAPRYVLYLGLRTEARERLKQLFPEAHTIVSQNQFFNERLDWKYRQRVGVVDCNKGYRLVRDSDIIEE